uniref:Ovule protein n=1 Tax=Haemonchus placei TaxID=6290 RepID=A0A0N4VXE1_HAEPC
LAVIGILGLRVIFSFSSRFSLFSLSFSSVFFSFRSSDFDLKLNPALFFSSFETTPEI